MHIDHKLNDKYGHLLVVNYDAEAQAAMARAHEAAERILKEPDIRLITESYGPVFIGRLETSLDLLNQMVGNASRTFEITDSDIQACFELTLVASEAGIAIEADISCFPDVIMLLAKVTSIVVPLFPLPPVSEVFDHDKVAPEVWEGYELMRHRAGAMSPRLGFLVIYQIWFALTQLRPTNSQLRCLLQHLDQATDLFRGAMKNQAVSVAQSAKVDTKSRRSKKS